MTEIKNYVLDTTSLISINYNLFSRDQILTKETFEFLNDVITNKNSSIRLSIPSVVFLEIHNKFFIEDEFRLQFFYDVYTPLADANNIEIRPIDKEILELTLGLGGALKDHEINDKIIVSSAIALECPLITTDTIIRNFSEDNPDILKIIY